MRLKEIKTPEDVYAWMEENIEYGWLDTYGNRHIDEMKHFRKLYRTMSTEEIFREKIGTCIEQVWIMKVLLDRIRTPNKMFCCRVYEADDFENMDDEGHMHCFVLFFRDGKCYHMEHPAYKRKGIYEYGAEQEAVKVITDRYIEMHGGQECPVTEFFEVPCGYSFQEFNCYIDDCMKEESKRRYKNGCR